MTKQVILTLGYAAPFDWPAMIGFLAARAIPGVEVAEPERYRRTIELDGCQGTAEVAPVPGRDALAATIRFANAAAVPAIAGRLRRLFDLDADVQTIARRLGRDPFLARLVAARPGLRVPGAWDGFELAVRAILGQQITVGAARQLLGKLVGSYGERLPFAGSSAPGLTSVFPGPERLATAELGTLGMPAARARSVSGLAAVAAADPELLLPRPEVDATVERLLALPGIGDWSAQYIAMRALRAPDAFPAADIGLRRAMMGADGVRPTAAALLARAEAWRPWRAYAAQHLWTSDVASPGRAVADQPNV